MDNQPGPVANRDLEQAQAGQVAAEQEAASLRSQLAAAEERAQKAGAMAALRESARTDGELAGLRSQIAALKTAHEAVASKVEQSYGENGVAVNDGVAHGSGDTNRNQAPDLPFRTLDIEIFGVIYQADVVILRLATLA